MRRPVSATCRAIRFISFTSRGHHTRSDVWTKADVARTLSGAIRFNETVEFATDRCCPTGPPYATPMARESGRTGSPTRASRRGRTTACRRGLRAEPRSTPSRCLNSVPPAQRQNRCGREFDPAQTFADAPVQRSRILERRDSGCIDDVGTPTGAGSTDVELNAVVGSPGDHVGVVAEFRFEVLQCHPELLNPASKGVAVLGEQIESL